MSIRPRSIALLLRGVNVGGVTAPMSAVRELLTGLGHPEATTLLASGQAVAQLGDGEAGDQLARRFEEALQERFGRAFPVRAVERDALERIAAGFPFVADDPQIQPYIVFCWDAETADALAALPEQDLALEEHAPGPDLTVYWRVATGSSVRSPFSTALTRAAVKPRTSTRNLRTVQRILEAMG